MTKVKFLILLGLTLISVHSCSIPDSKRSIAEELHCEEIKEILVLEPSPEAIYCGGKVIQKSIVTVDANSVCYFGDFIEPVELSEIEVLIMDHIEITKDSTVEFYGDGNSKLKVALEVIDICKRNHLKFVMKKKRV